MSGQIPLEYPFEASWLWESDPNTIWVSMIQVNEKERGKGHASKLIDSLLKKYKTIIVPEPNNLMVAMLKRRGFVFSTKAIHPNFDGSYMIWTESNQTT